MKRVSLKTIANELGVSSATVSLVLNGKNINGRVSNEMSKKILDKATELNYVPNTLAKGLKVGKSKSIGLIIADVSNLFFGALALHIQNYAHANGYTVLIGNTNENINEMEHMIKFLYARQVDGLIITPTENSQHLLNNLKKNNVPLVLVDRCFPDMEVNSVMINNYDISYQSTEELINKGCKNIAIVTYRQDHYHINERRNGAIDALKNSGINDENNVEEVSYHNLKDDITFSIEKLLKRNPKIDGIFFTTNSISINGVKALIKNKINIQKDIQIMCFDENDAFYILPYTVPFIKQPIKEIAKNAIELLIEQIESKSIDESKNIVLKAELVLNETRVHQ
ncbi:MAG: LacI family DNA-binding transcriptional regulator [Fermentimonas sp.]|nr:LacI family DNA-binding transcriptional regulator [Fermentimonas sp.]